MLEILDEYVKRHLIDGEPMILRELIRMVHSSLPPGPQKSKARGILAYYTRTTAPMNWVKVAEFLDCVATSSNVQTFTSERVLEWDRVVASDLVLREVTRPDSLMRMQLQSAKLDRLKKRTPSQIMQGVGE